MADLDSVIAESIADLPGAEADSGEPTEVADPTPSGEEPTLEPDANTETPPEPDSAVEPPPAKPEQQEDDPLAEFKGKKNNRIPYDRVQSILENQKTKLQKEFDQQLTTVQQKLAQYEHPEIQGMMRAMQVASEDPVQFIHVLAQHPAYQRILAPLFQQPEREDVGVEPDVDLGNGMRGYSPRQVQAMLAKEAKAVEDRIAQRFEQQFGPVVNEHRQTQIMRGAMERVQQQVTEAESWPGFADNKAEIAAALQSNPKLSLHDAYIKVVTPKLTASRDEMRKQVLAEMKQKKSASSLAPSASAPASDVDGSVDPVEAAIRQSIANLS